jgi:hypothetical protein
LGAGSGNHRACAPGARLRSALCRGSRSERCLVQSGGHSGCICEVVEVVEVVVQFLLGPREEEPEAVKNPNAAVAIDASVVPVIDPQLGVQVIGSAVRQSLRESRRPWPTSMVLEIRRRVGRRNGSLHRCGVGRRWQIALVRRSVAEPSVSVSASRNLLSIQG